NMQAGARLNVAGFDLRGVGSLQGSQLALAIASAAWCQDLDFSGAALQAINLRKADLTGCFFVQADLRGADLEGAQLNGAILAGAVLTSLPVGGHD
ncbi:pentapeptide repeat-containing protein, partial [Acinetobacter baumannii]